MLFWKQPLPSTRSQKTLPISPTRMLNEGFTEGGCRSGKSSRDEEYAQMFPS